MVFKLLLGSGTGRGFVPPKIIRHSNHPDYKSPVKKRSAPKPWTEPEWMIDYRRERDRSIWVICKRNGDTEWMKKLEEFWKEKDNGK